MRQKIALFASLLAVAIIIFGFAPSARCQWVQAAGPYGASVNCFTVSGTYLLAGTGGGAYRSSNNGTTWAAATGLTNGVYAFAASGTNLFAGTGNGVSLSTDNGASWASASSGLP